MDWPHSAIPPAASFTWHRLSLHSVLHSKQKENKKEEKKENSLLFFVRKERENIRPQGNEEESRQGRKSVSLFTKRNTADVWNGIETIFSFLFLLI